MRTRWEFQWKTSWEGGVLIWFCVGVLVLVGVGVNTHHQKWWWLDTVICGVWMAGWVLAPGIRLIKQNPPFKCVITSLPDMRVHYLPRESDEEY